MALVFLLDEHLRGPLWNAIERHNGGGEYVIDAIRVGDPADLPLGSTDSTILQWAEREGRIVLTEDKHEMPVHLDAHLQAGRHSPGVFTVRLGSLRSELLECLMLVAHVGDATEYRDAVTFVP